MKVVEMSKNVTITFVVVVVGNYSYWNGSLFKSLVTGNESMFLL